MSVEEWSSPPHADANAKMSAIRFMLRASTDSRVSEGRDLVNKLWLHNEILFGAIAIIS
jgi:hypothetical protein